MNKGYSSSPHESESEDDHQPKRAYIPIARKIELVLEAEQSVKKEQKISQNKFCEQNGIAPCQLQGWKKNLANLKKTLDKTTKKKTLKVCTHGCPSRLEKIRNKIMPWISGMIAGGKTMKVRRVAIECKRLEKSFRWMKRYKLFVTVQRFLRANGVVLQSVMHKAQDDPKAKQETAFGLFGNYKTATFCTESFEGIYNQHGPDSVQSKRVRSEDACFQRIKDGQRKRNENKCGLHHCSSRNLC
ncbi:hypothetical protein ACA910_007018 [Epithemia clementina (nom. ined.)]